MICKITIKDGEYFWGGPTCRGATMPITAGCDYDRDFRRAAPNQFTSLLLSSKGRYVWADGTFHMWVEGDLLFLEGDGFEVVEAGKTLRDAYVGAMKAHFPFENKTLPREFFKTAQYNTWMEFPYNPTQAGILGYAHDIIDNGFEPGIFMIDEGWQSYYGRWRFDAERFPDPKGMVDALHRLGFIVMLWVTPFVTPDGEHFAKSTMKEFNDYSKCQYVRTKTGDVALFKWWNGFSAALDFTKEWDCEFLDSKLQFLMDEYGVDGFKFDGGSYHLYHPENIVNGQAPDGYDAIELNRAWNEFGTRYRFHEFKDTFNGGGKAVIQRLSDRAHSWTNGGIDALIPSTLLQGLMGYPYVCPDMIGGGSWIYNFGDAEVDGELFVRMAQISALLPMMQFSWAPWRVLSDSHLDAVKSAARLHSEMADEIIAYVDRARRDGEPIIRSLEYNFPEGGYATVNDQFMLGTDILVCPVTTKETYRRDVVFPVGVWQDTDGNNYEGPATVCLDSPVEKLLWFRKIK